MTIHELKYSNTNTYLIEGTKGRLLFDTGWAGTFSAFCACMGRNDIPVQGIDYILISHFHPDHMGIAQEIADIGPDIVVLDVQKDFIHNADEVFAKEGNRAFKPIMGEKVRNLRIRDSRAFLHELGIEGEILHTPGHSNDSISLSLDDGELFVGDLNPLYELELHKGTQIEESWNRLLSLEPTTVYYGHAKAGIIGAVSPITEKQDDRFELVAKIMKYIDKGTSIDKIQILNGEGKRQVKQWYMNFKQITRDDQKEAAVDSAIFHVCRTDWIIKVVDMVMDKVNAFCPYGELYHEILYLAYIVEEKITDNDILEKLNLERSTYYRRKREAIFLAGILLWDEAREKCFV